MIAERLGAEILEFLAPGLTHAMGNCLFSIQGHAQMLRGSDAEIARDKAAILKATEKALHALSVQRFLTADAGSEPAPQAGVLLHRLCELLRVPLREHGLALRFEHLSTETPVHVAGTSLCRIVVDVARRLAAAMPGCVEATVEIALVSQRQDQVLVAVRVKNDPSHLPFPFDLDSVSATLRPVLDDHSAALEHDGRQLWLRIPAAGAGAANAAQLR